MPAVFSKIFLKVLKITGITVGSLLVLMFLLPYLFPGLVESKIRQWAKGSIRSELNFSGARLSFFKHFPSLTLTLYDFNLKGSDPFPKDILVEAREISLGVDLSSVFSHRISIDKIFLTNAFINIQVDTAGHANYNVYVSKNSGPSPANAADTGSASLKIKKILIEGSKLVYNDRSLPMLINARGLYYRGSGDLDKAVFDLNTHTEIESLDFYYDRQAYFLSKKVNADLITKINTNSLALVFEKNQLTINKLPVTFTGSFGFLKNGYDMDFKLKSTDSDLHDIFTALPPNMVDWLDKTEVKGFGDIDASLAGKYIPSMNQMPDLSVNMKIRDGFISNAQAPSPVKNLFLNFQTRLPGLNTDSLSATVDSLYFNIDQDYFNAVVRLKGLKEPEVNAKINSEIDLEKWGKAFGVTPFTVRGRVALHLQADGRYATRLIRHEGLRKTTVDTVITSIPRFKLQSSMRNGYFKYASLPEAVKNISFDLLADCPDNDYKHMSLGLENINARVLTSYIRGFFKMGNASDFPIDANLETVFHLGDLKKVYPLDSMTLAGDLKVNILTKGNYMPSKKMLPVTLANLDLDNGSIQTKYYPHPLEQIKVSAQVSSYTGSMKDLAVTILPVSFLLEGQPFTVRADLRNFDDLRYTIRSRGILDLGKIYRIFAIKGYDVNGFIETNLSLKGRQSDASAGRYSLLFNSGTMKVKDLQLRSELFPLPFLIRTGLFRFDQDKMWFDTFHASYGKSHLTLNGHLSNVLDYMTNQRSPLRGSFDLKSDYILVDEFTAFAQPAADPKARTPKTPVSKAADGQTAPGAAAASTAGVVIIPDNLSISFNAAAEKVRYNGIDLDSFRGQLVLDSGKLRLNKTRFTLIGAPIEMDAAYQSLSPQRAQFDYHIRAKEFDVKRAYREIKLFHDLASSASKAEGIISLDYQLGGKLDGSMHPVYPSLKGGGILSVKKVKMKGLKLFGAVSKESGKDVNDPDLSKVELKSTINNNLITIERTRMKVSVFKLRMEGQASFDGKMNLRFRVGLPPFGVIGIPLKITGTQDDPKVRSGRGNKSDELEETEDKEEEGKDN